MPNYAVLYKTEADHDGRLWPVGRFPDRNHALDILNNSTAKVDKIGPFTFVEQETPNGPEILYPLYDG